LQKPAARLSASCIFHFRSRQRDTSGPVFGYACWLPRHIKKFHPRGTHFPGLIALCPHARSQFVPFKGVFKNKRCQTFAPSRWNWRCTASLYVNIRSPPPPLSINLFANLYAFLVTMLSYLVCQYQAIYIVHFLWGLKYTARDENNFFVDLIKWRWTSQRELIDNGKAVTDRDISILLIVKWDMLHFVLITILISQNLVKNCKRTCNLFYFKIITHTLIL
jgi:hypothetical protein